MSNKGRRIPYPESSLPPLNAEYERDPVIRAAKFFFEFAERMLIIAAIQFAAHALNSKVLRVFWFIGAVFFTMWLVHTFNYTWFALQRRLELRERQPIRNALFLLVFLAFTALFGTAMLALPSALAALGSRG